MPYPARPTLSTGGKGEGGGGATPAHAVVGSVPAEDAKGAAAVKVDDVGAEGGDDDAAEEEGGGVTAGVVTSGGGRAGAARAGGAVVTSGASCCPPSWAPKGWPISAPTRCGGGPLGLAWARAAASAAWRCAANSLAMLLSMASW